ncbi:MAG TPA: twin-arginine translocase TatA/TatE family subunit [Bryobacteraceae bacterium]|nr:twin-arginine translocase TatA/TatE family subunit [Bryobacteraceae bacterium]
MEPAGIQAAGVFGLGGPELLFIFLLALVLFGGKKVGDLGKGLGEGIRNFKKALNEDEKPNDEKKQQQAS